MSFQRLLIELRELRELLRAGVRRRLYHPPPGAGRRYDWRRRLAGYDPSALLRTPLMDARFVMLDTETTGLEAYGGDEIVEIALLEYHGLEPTGREFWSRVDPGIPVPPESTAIHGIGDADVAGAPHLDTVMERILPFIDDAVLVGHHIAFDLRFLNRAIRRIVHRQLPHPAINTMTLYQAWTGQLGHHALGEVASACNVPLHDRHSARGDAVICGSIFRYLAPRLLAGDATVADLLAVAPPAPEYGPGNAPDSGPHPPGTH